MRNRLALFAAIATLALAPVVANAQAPGWARMDLAGGAYAERFIPHGVRVCDPLPVAVFLHGAGGTPEGYESYLESHAEALGLVLVLPASSSTTGWSSADTPTISAALDAIALQVNVDGTRTYFSGHSAGAAMAYLTGYEDATGIAALFVLSAPSYPVGSLAEPTYRAPIHMYYGADDPNYTMGAAAANTAMWTRLGIPSETDVQTGYGHSTWPDSSMRAGLVFLLAHHYPGAPPASTCAGSDAGSMTTDAAVDGSVAHDAGAPTDAGTTLSDAARDARADARTDAQADGGTGTVGGCSCTTPRPTRGGGARVLGALVVLGVVLRRRVVSKRRG